MRILLTIITLLALAACKKSEPQKPVEEELGEKCYTYPLSTNQFGYNWKITGPQFAAPHFTGQNSFIYYKTVIDDLGNIAVEIMEYDMVTKTEIQLGTYFKPIDYFIANKQGDAIFFEGGIIGFRENLLFREGRLEPIPVGSLGLSFPVWVVGGNSYAYAGDTAIYIRDKNFTLVKSISWKKDYTRLLDFSEDSVAVIYTTDNYARAKCLYLLNISNGDMKQLPYIGDEMLCIKWHPNKKDIYYTDKYGFFKLDTDSKISTRILEACDTRTYQAFSFINDTTLLMERKNYRWMDSTLLQVQSMIYKIDRKGNTLERMF